METFRENSNVLEDTSIDPLDPVSKTVNPPIKKKKRKEKRKRLMNNLDLDLAMDGSLLWGHLKLSLEPSASFCLETKG